MVSSPPPPPDPAADPARSGSPAPTPRRPRPLSILLILVPLALMAIAVAFFAVRMRPDPTTVPPTPAAAAAATHPSADARPSATSPSATTAAPPGAAPSTPWRTLAPDSTLTRIAVGSCLDQIKPQPIWNAVSEAKPDLVLMIGDNVYGDMKGGKVDLLADAYRRQLRHPQFAAARAALPMLGIWDDHDYGLNDGGADFPLKQESLRLYREFWEIPETALPAGGGAYRSHVFGPQERRVQILMLDTRFFRSPFKPKTEAFPHWGKYEPDPDPGKTMLGSAQWDWLAAELQKPAVIRLVISSIQVISNGHGFERWGNLPHERDRLMNALKAARGGTIALLSGDRHIGALYAHDLGDGRVVPEMTASSLNRSYGPSRDARTPELKSPLFHPENFGLVDIDWDARTLTLQLLDIGGGTVGAVSVPIAR